MSVFNWAVRVRVTGRRDGWESTLVDTPTIEFRSNPQFGGMWTSSDSVARSARDMFARLVIPGDVIHVDVTSLPDDDSAPKLVSYVF